MSTNSEGTHPHGDWITIAPRRLRDVINLLTSSTSKYIAQQEGNDTKHKDWWELVPKLDTVRTNRELADLLGMDGSKRYSSIEVLQFLGKSFPVIYEVNEIANANPTVNAVHDWKIRTKMSSQDELSAPLLEDSAPATMKDDNEDKNKRNDDDNEWKTVGSEGAKPNTAPVDAINVTTETTNQYGELSDPSGDNLNEEDEMDESKAETIENDEETSTIVNLSEISNKTKKRIKELTDERIRQITDIVKDGDVEKIPLDELVQWVEQTLNCAAASCTAEIKREFNRSKNDLHSHKNKLTKSMKAAFDDVNTRIVGMRKEIIGVKTELEGESNNYVIHINSHGAKVMQNVDDKVEQLEEVLQKVSQKKEEIVQLDELLENIQTNAESTKTEVMEICKNAFDTMCTNLDDLVEDEKRNYKVWLETTTNTIGYDRDRSKRLLQERKKYEERMKALDDKIADVELAERKLTLMERTKEDMFDELYQKYEKLMEDAKAKGEEYMKLIEEEKTKQTSPLLVTSQDHAKPPDLVTSSTNHNSVYQIGDNVTHVLQNGETQKAVVTGINKDSDVPTYSIITLQNRMILDNVMASTLKHDTMATTTSQDEMQNPDYDYDNVMYDEEELLDEKPRVGGIWRQDLSHFDETEFAYPLSSKTRKVMGQSLIRFGKEWEFKLYQDEDLKQFYHSLQLRLASYNVLLKSYDSINSNTNILLIEPENCLNYENAARVMSRVLFTYFDDNKDSIFATFKKPLTYFEAFRTNTDGTGFLKYMLKEIHPKLKAPTDDIVDTKPEMSKCSSIHTYINALRSWLQDEELKGRVYSNTENMSTIIHNLDDRFTTAKEYLRNVVNTAISNKRGIPQKWTMQNAGLSLAIEELIPKQDRDCIDLTNEVPTINRISQEYNDKDRQYGMSRKTNNDKQKRYGQKSSSTSYEPKYRWADDLNWKFLPDEICPACGKFGHNVYKTGCDSLPIWASCQEFHEKHATDPKYKMMLGHFKQFQKKKRDNRLKKKKEYRRMVKNVDGNTEATCVIKKMLLKEYNEEFPEHAMDDIDDVLAMDDESTSSSDNSEE